MKEVSHSLRAIFVEALEIRDPLERAEYLSRMCGTDPPLRREVEELLEAEAAAGRFLPKQPGTGGSQAALLAAIKAFDSAGSASDLAAPEGPGDWVGRYKLLQKIGEGGCGLVYMAEQRTPVRRNVALKVIKLGMDTRQVVARFEAERQALALMDHPNIAKVLDAGATETGRPFFVMELVRGIKITEYCDQQALSTRERLELFIQVCQAVQHAHQKGIIHRDLKPSNILVTVNDGVAVPKVIDFGIAKATAGRLTDRTLFTAFEQFLGTPAYMSPEQTEMTSVDIDTRSDIYSLGVLLYELLTGMTPFDTQALLAEGMDQMRRTIREREPPRPSARLSTMAEADLTTTAKRRGEEPPRLIHRVRGDLDWIVMKCLEKDRNRRYATANGLAADIMRYLKSEPVVASPPSKVYRFRKLVQRNKMMFAAAGVGTAALLIGLGVSTGLLFEERAARRGAVVAELKAQTETHKSQQTVGILRDMLGRVLVSMSEERDNSTALLEFFDKTAHEARTDLQNQPELAEYVQSTLALLYLEFDENQKAEELARLALASARKRADKQDSFVGPLLALRDVLLAEHKFEEAAKLFEEDFSLKGAGAQGQTARFLSMRGDLRARIGRWQEAAADFWKVIELAPNSHEGYFKLAPLLVQSDEVAAYRRLCEQIRARFGTATDDASVANQMANSCLLLPASGADLAAGSRLADVAARLGRGRSNEAWCQLSKSLAEYRQGHYASAVEWALKVLTAEGTRPRRDVEAYMILAMAKHQLKRASEARAALTRGVAIAQEHMPSLEGTDLTDGWVDWLVAYALMREAKALIEMNRT